MVWMLVVVIAASVAYAVSVVSEYTAFVKKIQPRMAGLLKQSENLRRLIEVESGEVNRMEASLSAERDQIEGLHREIVSAQNELKQQSVKEQELEVAVYKQEFRMSKRKL